MMVRLISFAWSNVWRNPRRTTITVGALALGMTGISLTLSVMEGLTRDLVDQGTALLLGHVQVHSSSYLPNRSIFDTIPGDGPALADRLHGHSEVLAATPRASGFGLVSFGDQSAGVELIGITPLREAEVSRLHRAIVAGHWLDEAAEHPVAMGDALREALGLEVGDFLALLIQGADGSLGADMFQLVGVFHTELETIDGALVVMMLNDLQRLLALESSEIHEIAIRTNAPAQAQVVGAHLEGDFGNSGIKISAWPELAPELGGWMALTEGWMGIGYGIVLVLAVVAILNTMLMAVFERLREFGILTAIGMKPLHIVAVVTAEVAVLAMVSIVAATFLSLPLLYWIVESGIDLSPFVGELTLSGVAFSPLIRGAWVFDRFVASALLLILFALLAGIYPAIRAAGTNPAALSGGRTQ